MRVEAVRMAKGFLMHSRYRSYEKKRTPNPVLDGFINRRKARLCLLVVKRSKD